MIRLVFSEAVVAELSQVVVTGSAGTSQTLRVMKKPGGPTIKEFPEGLFIAFCHLLLQFFIPVFIVVAQK